MNMTIGDDHFHLSLDAPRGSKFSAFEFYVNSTLRPGEESTAYFMFTNQRNEHFYIPGTMDTRNPNWFNDKIGEATVPACATRIEAAAATLKLFLEFVETYIENVEPPARVKMTIEVG